MGFIQSIYEIKILVGSGRGKDWGITVGLMIIFEAVVTSKLIETTACTYTNSFNHFTSYLPYNHYNLVGKCICALTGKKTLSSEMLMVKVLLPKTNHSRT